jgi:pyrroloquinoline quinone biosynthesis protein B
VRILVLGSAAGGGFPQWNCGCGNCRRARAGDAAARPRTQSSLAVSAGGDWLLLNASPDLRQQILAAPALHPRGGRDSPIAAVALTSADVDHVAGLLTLRERQAFALYASARVHAALARNPIFGVLAPELVERREFALEAPLGVADARGAPLGVALTAFAVPGKVALYLEDASAGPDFGTEAGDTVGLEIAAGGRRAVYIPGCAALPADLLARIAGADILFFDGTLWRDDELVAAGLGAKSGRRMGHVSIAGAAGTLAAFAGVEVGRKMFVHMNNTNPILLDDSPERAEVERAGWEVARDGMEIGL